MPTTFNDQPLLEAWAEGRAGATPRIAKRAWLVLESLNRRDPYLLGDVGSGTGRVQQWLARYRSMGALGLLDAPREGRPRTVSNEVAKLVALSADEDAKDQVRQAMEQMDRPRREAFWRGNRKENQSLTRDTRVPTFRVEPPDGMESLIGMISVPDLLLIARLENSGSAEYLGPGRWIMMGRRAMLERSRLAVPPSVSGVPLLGAMWLSGQVNHDAEKTRLRSAPHKSLMLAVYQCLSRIHQHARDPWVIHACLDNKASEIPHLLRLIPGLLSSEPTARISNILTRRGTTQWAGLLAQRPAVYMESYSKRSIASQSALANFGNYGVKQEVLEKMRSLISTDIPAIWTRGW